MKFVSFKYLHGTDAHSQRLSLLTHYPTHTRARTHPHTQRALSISPRSSHSARIYFLLAWRWNGRCFPLTVGREKSLMFHFMCQTSLMKKYAASYAFWNKAMELSLWISAFEILVTIKPVANQVDSKIKKI